MERVTNPVQQDIKYKKKVEKFQSLVDELMKDQPNEPEVKKMMESVGIEYKNEPIERLNLVLQALHK